MQKLPLVPLMTLQVEPATKALQVPAGAGKKLVQKLRFGARTEQLLAAMNTEHCLGT